MNELRWIILAVGLLVVLGIYLHGRRKRFGPLDQTATREPSRDANLPELDEPAIVRRRETPGLMTPRANEVAMDELPEVRAHPAPLSAGPMGKLTPEQAMSTAALDRLTITQPLSVRTNASVASHRDDAFSENHTAEIESSKATARPGAASATPRAARKIVALRVPATTNLFPGAELKDAFFSHGLRHGRYGIYHRNHSTGVPIFSVASIVEPGTFDPATMPNESYPGVSLFLQLPGPEDGVASFDAMLECARALQREFDGVVQGERGKELTDDVVDRIREDIANFQHLMHSASTNG